MISIWKLGALLVNQTEVFCNHVIKHQFPELTLFCFFGEKIARQCKAFNITKQQAYIYVTLLVNAMFTVNRKYKSMQGIISMGGKENNLRETYNMNGNKIQLTISF